MISGIKRTRLAIDVQEGLEYLFVASRSEGFATITTATVCNSKSGRVEYFRRSPSYNEVGG